MAFCKKCGAYIPIDETACPACGYDPEEEARQAAEAKKRAEEEEKRKKAQADSWAAQERAREDAARRRAQQQNARTSYSAGAAQQGARASYTGGAAQSQYTSQRTGQSSAYQGQSASQRTGETWVPPWSQQSTARQGAAQRDASSYEELHRQAQESVQNQRLSVLSYFWPFALIPMILRGKDDFARYHTNQGLVLLIATAVASAVAGGLGIGVLDAAVVGFNIFCKIKGVANVLQGKKEPLPLIGGIKLFK